tara:strand:- start:2195 stop:2365 length:171 start_codon:yes stop_codon:yes gene_type:complete
VTVAGKETIKLTLLTGKTIKLKLQDRLDLTMTLKPLLMGKGELGKRDQGKKQASNL